MGQLLQVWQDYYDEIFEVDIDKGYFESLMESDNSYWVTSGFVGIEVILLAEKMIHPDDKEAFSTFFDLDHIKKCIHDGIFVTKLSFRMKRQDGTYAWVKAKNIVPTKQEKDSFKFFACFRKVDAETSEDLRYKQELSDALESERALCREKTELIRRMVSEIRSPLNGIIGIAGMAKTNDTDCEALKGHMALIEEESLKMNNALKSIVEANVRDDIPFMEFENHPVNKISYQMKTPEVSEKETKPETELPENFAFVNEVNEAFTADNRYDFSGKRVLVVEDNKLNAEVMKELFLQTGAEVDIAEDGKQAVVKFIAHPAGTYDVILMDIEIPIIDGLSATKCIRICGKEDGETVPIFAVTSNSMSDDIVKTYEYGFNAFFAKPVDFRVLFKRVGELFES